VGNLRDRLKRIQTIQQSQPAKQASVSASLEGNTEAGRDISAFLTCGWSSAGFLTLKREMDCGPFALPHNMPVSACMVMPGINSETAYESLLFFDLETTGLSTGAGTIAFLAAFGRFVHDGAKYVLSITQYLLLDFPGEYDFINALLGEITDGSVIVSYNGKNFDSPILNARCLMNGIPPREYCHADLLYPARRLWKRLLPDCRQGTVETGILGIDRAGDVPGSMAPEIWFSFLKDNDPQPLLGICEHNRRDIAGLASIFCTMAQIAEDPAATAKRIKFDLAAFLPRARLLFREGKYNEGRELLFTAADYSASAITQSLALRMLAIDSEWRQKDRLLALELARRALQILPPDSPLRKDFEHREQRLRPHAEFVEAQRE
jgi:uncharacterized protein YprB with RNaseH-like and TPR domain